jgi:hypothetical protein
MRFKSVSTGALAIAGRSRPEKRKQLNIADGVRQAVAGREETGK